MSSLTLTDLENVQVLDEWQAGKFAILPSDEDIHTANERRLTVSDIVFI